MARSGQVDAPRRLAALSASVAAILVAVPVLTGVPWSTAITWTAVIAVQSLGGALLWRVLAGPVRAVELAGMGIALGTALAVVPGTLLAPLPGGSAAWSLAPASVAALAFAVRRARRGPIARCLPVHRGTGRALVLGLVLGLAAFALNVRAYPLGTERSWTDFHSDMPYFEALSRSFAQFGPWDSLLADGFALRYHALAYAWAGELTSAADAGPFATLTRALPLVATIGTVLLAIAWSQRLARSRWLPSLAVVVLLAGGYVGATYGSVLNFDSPSQSMGAMWLMGLVIVATAAWPDGSGRRAAWLATIAMLAFALTGGKVSSAAVGVAGLAAWALVAVVRRADGARAAGAAVASLIGAFAAFALLLAGAADAGGLTPFSLVDRASSQQGLNPIPGSLGVIAGTTALALAIALRWAGVGWLIVDRRWRRRPETIVSWGMALASLAAMLVFNGGLNETWFAAGASGPLAVTTSLGALLAFRWLRDERGTGPGARRIPRRGTAIAALAALTVLATAVTWSLWLTGPSGGNVWVPTARWAAPFAAVSVAVIGGVAWALAYRVRRNALTVAAVSVVVLVGTASSMRAIGIGSGMVGTQPGFREELFSMATSDPVRGTDATVPSALTPEELAAAAWARANLPEGTLMASGLTFSPIVPALTGRQSFVSGLQFQVPYGREGDAGPLLARAGTVEAFMAAPGPATIAPLCDAGVRALWLDPDVASLAEAAGAVVPLFANAAVVIAQPRCP